MTIPHLATPGRAPRQNAAARLFNVASWAECQRIAAAFRFELAWEDDPDGRTLMLLGADSPAEMTMRIAWRDLDNRRLATTTGRVLHWMLERGAYWRGVDVDWLALRRAVLGEERTD